MRGWYGNSNGTEGGRLKRKARRWKDEGLDDLRMMMKRVLLFLLYFLGAVRVFLGKQRCGLHVTGGVRACVRAGTLHAIVAGC